MSKYKIHITMVLILSGLVYAAWTYPPDNAALLYYRAFALMDSASSTFMINPSSFSGSYSVRRDNKDPNTGSCIMVSGGESQAIGGCKIVPDTIECRIIKDINDCNLKNCVVISPSGCDANFLKSHIELGPTVISCSNAPDINSCVCPHGHKIISKGNTIVSRGNTVISRGGFGGHYGGIVKYVKIGAEPNEPLKGFIECNPAVDAAIAASKIENCDWGIDPCNFMREFMPHLGGMRRLGYLLIAASKVAAKEGDYDAAFERCLAVKRMAHHKTPTMFKMEGLVNITLEKMANEQIQKLLAEIDSDTAKLQWVKDEINAIESRAPLSLRDCISYEKEMFGSSCGSSSGISIVKMKVMFDSNDLKNNKQSFKMSVTRPNGESYTIDGNSLDVNAESGSVDYKAMTEEALNLWDKPYNEAYEGFKKLAASGPQIAFCDTEGSGKSKTVVQMTTFDFGFSYSEDILNRTMNNAVKAAIEVYLQKARTGRLPAVLPSGLPKDLYSGQDFDYEVTQNGFILRCKGKDLNKNKIHEFEFKVKS